MDYESIKALARDRGCKVNDMLALAPANDPFYTGAAATVEAAEWFADLFQQFGYTTGVHLRRMHYQVVSRQGTKPDGEAYENTEGDWKYLCSAGKYARYLNLVDPCAFIDRRNPDPHIFASGADYDAGIGYSFSEGTLQLPSLSATFSVNIDLPGIGVHGYDYSEACQPYHLELWIEKSTMDDVLLPICQRWGVNVVTSLGFQSITSVLSLLHRIVQSRKPARIFYISDFDPAGDGMPTAAARQLEYWIGRYAPGANAALTPIALTGDQVVHYALPRIPVKDTDRRKDGFEARNGAGAVELDALEALHPGVLADIVTDAITPYRDSELEGQLNEAEDEADEIAESAWRKATANLSDEAGAIEEEALAIAKRYQKRAARLQADLEASLAPVRERMERLRHAISGAMDRFEVELPDRPTADPGDNDESGWLYGSWRDYESQMDAYKERKGGVEYPVGNDLNSMFNAFFASR